MRKRFAWHLMLFFITILIVTGPKWSDAQSPSAYDTIGLMSNSAVWTLNFDTSLLDPQGMARTPDGPWRVADEGKGRVTPYNGDGVAFPGLSQLVVFLSANPAKIYDEPAPMGIVYNDTKDFELAPDHPAEFLVATRDGTIEGWNGDVYRNSAVLVVDNSPDAAYTGIAIAQTEGGTRLYAANFRQSRIDVFDGAFSPLLLPVHAFTDPAIPDGFSPFNIQNINNFLYVTFAAQAADPRHAAAGERSGYVTVFDAGGKLVMRFEQGPWMNAPWGVAQSPDRFGEYGSHLLVGNSGSGRIAAFDQNTGLFAGFLLTRGGAPVTVPGLHGLGFGNDGLAGDSDTLYFTAGFRNGEPNIFGAIRAVAAVQRGPVLDMATGPAASPLY
jgi:uncharacterized protein (TIGR03118 family)